METKKIKTKEDFNLLIQELKYGTNDVILDSDTCIELLNSYVDLCEIISKNILISVKNSYIKSVVSIVWHDRTMAPPIFNIDELSLKSIISKVAESKESLVVNIRKELVKYATKLSKNAGVKFNNTVFGQSISAVGVKKSAYKMIEDALEAGDTAVVFSRLDYNPQTIRVYSSQINKFRNIRTSVSIDGDKITLILTKKNNSSTEIFDLFRKSEVQNGLKDTLYMFYKTIQMHTSKRLITNEDANGNWTYIQEESPISADSMDAISEYITKNPIQAIDTALEELVFDDKITTSMYSDIIRMVKNTENKAADGSLELLNAEEGVTGGIMPQAAPMTAAATTTGSSEDSGANDSSSDDEPEIEIMDGLRQIVIPGLRESIDRPDPMPEDDDF